MLTTVRFLEGVALKLLPYHQALTEGYELPIAIEFIKRGAALEPFVVGSNVFVHAIGGHEYEWGMSEQNYSIGDSVRIAKRVDRELCVWAIQRLKV